MDKLSSLPLVELTEQEATDIGGGTDFWDWVRKLYPIGDGPIPMDPSSAPAPMY
ncbi:MAG TPA: hypothetical protein VF615_05930 [Longimicrobiaceae bacterium]|jgi:hypothetical protein